MIDGTMGADGEGPFAPTRIGSVPVLQLLDYIEAHSIDDVRRMCSRSGGFVSLFEAVLVWNTMIYQVCKSIGAMSAVLSGKVDAIVLTGGLMRFNDIAEKITERCGWIAPVHVYAHELEQDTLALSVLKVLRGQAKAMTYSGKNVWQGFEGMDI